MLFSVIIPTYNRVALLKEAVASVSLQSFTDYEVIVVDDGSTDGTADYIQGLNHKLRVLRQPNRGPGAARNFAATNAQGQYLAFLDSDDLWFPWTLSLFAEAISKFSSPTLLSGEFIEFANENEIDTAQNQPSEMVYFRDFLASSEMSYSVGAGTCVLSREAFLRARFLEDQLNGEDHDLILRMGTQRGFVRIVRPSTLAYRRHGNRETGNLTRAVGGTLRLLRRERSGAYPGGPRRAAERRRILTRHARPIALACLQEGRLRQGWDVYRSILVWNARLGRWRFLLGFPALALLILLRRRRIEQ